MQSRTYRRTLIKNIVITFLVFQADVNSLLSPLNFYCVKVLSLFEVSTFCWPKKCNKHSQQRNIFMQTWLCMYREVGAGFLAYLLILLHYKIYNSPTNLVSCLLVSINILILRMFCGYLFSDLRLFFSF